MCKKQFLVDPTVAYAIEYETLIAFTYDAVRNFWHQDRGKKVEENKKRNEEEKSFLTLRPFFFLATCCVLLLNVLLMWIYTQHVIAFGTYKYTSYPRRHWINYEALFFHRSSLKSVAERMKQSRITLWSCHSRDLNKSSTSGIKPKTGMWVQKSSSTKESTLALQSLHFNMNILDLWLILTK